MFRHLYIWGGTFSLSEKNVTEKKMANGKFYHLGLGSKKFPLHFLTPHGAFQVENLPTLKHKDLLSWFKDCSEGKIEGIVWHCGDGCLIKVMTKT